MNKKILGIIGLLFILLSLNFVSAGYPLPYYDYLLNNANYGIQWEGPYKDGTLFVSNMNQPNCGPFGCYDNMYGNYYPQSYYNDPYNYYNEYDSGYSPYSNYNSGYPSSYGYGYPSSYGNYGNFFNPGYGSWCGYSWCYQEPSYSITYADTTTHTTYYSVQYGNAARANVVSGGFNDDPANGFVYNNFGKQS